MAYRCSSPSSRRPCPRFGRRSDRGGNGPRESRQVEAIGRWRDRDFAGNADSDDEVDVKRLLLVGADVDIEVDAVALGIHLLAATYRLSFRIDESEEVVEVDAGEVDQFCEGTGKCVVGTEEIDVSRAPAGPDASEHSGGALKEPV